MLRNISLMVGRDPHRVLMLALLIPLGAAHPTQVLALDAKPSSIDAAVAGSQSTCFKMSRIPNNKVMLELLENTCDVCKVAVIRFVYVDGRSPAERSFIVRAKGNTQINISRTSSVQVVRETACPGA